MEFDIDKIAEEIASRYPGNAMEGFEDAIAKSEKWAESQPRKLLEHARRRLDESWFPNVKATAMGLGSDWLPMILRAAGDVKNADLAHNMGEAYQQAIEERSPGAIKRALRGVARTLPTAIATSPSGPGGMIGTFAVQEWDRALTEGKEAGLTPKQTLGYAATQGAIEGGIAGLFQLAGAGGLEKTLGRGARKAATRGLKDGLKAAGVTAIHELPEEVLTELGHNVASRVSDVDKEAMSWETTRGTIQDTVLQTLLTVGVAEAPNVAASYRSGDLKRIAGEIVDTAQKGVKVSREQWSKWGFSPITGKSLKQRITRVREIASEITNKAAKQQETQAQTEAAQPVAEATELTPSTQDVAAAVVPQLAEQSAEASPVTEATPDVVEASRAARLAPSQHDFPVNMQGTGEEIGGREVVRQLQQIWGTPLNLGHMSAHRNARGIYKTRRHVARLASGEEASPAVAIHEAIGHHLDFTTNVLKSAPKSAKQELGNLDYDQKAKRPFEGFAEFMRGYLTGAIEIRKGGVNLEKEAPQFWAHFQSWLASHPDIQAKLIESREPIMSFIRAGAVGRVKGQISKTGLDETRKPPLRQRVGEWAQYLYTRLKDEGRPVSRFTEEAIAKGYTPSQGEVTPYEEYNALRNAGSHFAQNAIEHGVYTLSGTPTKIGPSLYEVMRDIEPGEDSRNFAAWAYARHAIESWGKIKNPGITLEDAQEAVKQLYDPRYERAANGLTEFNNALIRVLADAGVLTSEEADKIQQAYTHYIPLERAKEGTHPAGGRRMIDLSPAIRGRKGSGLQIIDPIESTLSRAVRFYERAAKQLVINRIIEVSDNAKGLGGWIDDVSTRIRGTTTTVEEIKEKLLDEYEKSAGFGHPDVSILESLLDVIDPNTALTIWRPDMTKKSGEPIYRVVVKGEPKFYQIDPELAKSLGGLDSVHHLDPVSRIMRCLTGFLKLGATHFDPSFIVSNALRDFQTFLIHGEKGLKGAFDPVRYLCAYTFHEWKRMGGVDDELPEIKLFKMMGGELSTYAGLDRARLMKGRARVLRGKQSKLDTLSNIIGSTEVAPRIAEWKAVLEREGWWDVARSGGMPPMNVMIRAINAAHDVTVDFRRMGQWGRYLNYYIPFFNARLEGFDKFVREVVTNPKKRALVVCKTVVLSSMIYWWLRHDDDDYKERPAWQDNYYILKDGEGNPVWRIPKPHEWGLIGNGVERMLDAMYDRDPEAVNRWFGNALGNINPGGLPAGVTLLFESMFNYDSFRGREIESKTLQKLEPYRRYYEHSTDVAKAAARELRKVSGGRVNLSPARIDHLANGLTGGLFGKVDSYAKFGANLFSGGELSMADVPGLKGVTLRADYARSVDDFYQMKEKLDQRIQTAEVEGQEVSQEITDSFDRVGFSESLMSDIRRAAQKLPAAERVEAQLAIVGLARAALGRSPLKRYPNPLADPSVVPAGCRKVVIDHIAKKAINAASTSDSAAASRKYLKQMGVATDVAQALAYNRLRSHGISSEAAARRARSGF